MLLFVKHCKENLPALKSKLFTTTRAKCMNNGGFCTAVCSASYEECAPLPKLMSQVSRHCKTAFLTSKCIHIMLLLDNKGNASI